MQTSMAYWYAAWIIVPMLPAFLFFKIFPSDATATGPLLGMRWKLGGAFAGYAFVFLAANLFLISDVKKAILEEHAAQLAATQAELGEKWTITGQIRKADGSVPFEAKFVTQPPIGEIRDNGSFSVEVLLPRRKSKDEPPPDLLIKCEKFETVGVSLPWDEESKRNLPPAKYSAERNPEKNTIKITPVVVLDPQ